jgi:hypothetical protein
MGKTCHERASLLRKYLLLSEEISLLTARLSNAAVGTDWAVVLTRMSLVQQNANQAMAMLKCHLIDHGCWPEVLKTIREEFVPLPPELRFPCPN